MASNEDAPEIPIVTEYSAYNYPHFLAGPDDAEFERFQAMLRVGASVPDFEAHRLDDGVLVRLSDYTAEKNVVLEFGSFT